MTPEEARWYELYGKISDTANELQLNEDAAAMAKNYILADTHRIQRETLHLVLQLMHETEEQQ